jgi:transcriptional regulator with XRE-family HTH domain
MIEGSLPGPLLAATRRGAGLTQTELSRRLGISQAAVAQLERPDSNPRLATLDRALRAAGSELFLAVRPRERTVDETLVRRHLELSPRQRLAALESMQGDAGMLARAGRVSRGEPA